MKRICLIAGNTLPVPAVMGGAIEELVTILLEQNEIEKKAELIVFTRAHEEAEALAEHYQHAKVIFIPADNVYDKIVNRIRRYTAMLLGMKPGALLDSGYHRKIYKVLRKMEADAYVLEGGLFHEFRCFSEKFGVDKTYLRIHHHVQAEPEYDEIFGNIIAVSNFAQNEWLRTTKKTDIGAHVVYNCVNEDKFTKRIRTEEREKLREKLGIEKEDFVVFYCGRIQEVKGVRELLQAFAEIDRPGCKLLMVGNADFGVNTQTPFMQEIQQLVAQDMERICFTGYIENQNLYQYYQCADIQVVPSMWEEAAGLVAIEGMISGLPLIVTRSGGLIEYAPETVALWVERENIVKNLTEAMQMLYDLPDKRLEMSKASLEHAKQFTKRSFYQNYMQVFDESKER